MHALRRRLPGQGPDWHSLASRHTAPSDFGCTGMRSMEEGTLLSVPSGAQLRHLLGCLPVWHKGVETLKGEIAMIVRMYDVFYES
jgi:hypothetical protein